MRISEPTASGTPRAVPLGAILSYVASVIVVAAAACAGPSTGVVASHGSGRTLGSNLASPTPPAPLCSPSPTYQCIVVPFGDQGSFVALPPLGGYTSAVSLSRNQYHHEKIVGPTVGVATVVPPGLTPFPGPSPLLYFTEQTPVNVAMNNVSSFTLTLPNSVKKANRQFYLAFLDPNNLGAGWQMMAVMERKASTLTFDPNFQLAETWQVGQIYGLAVLDMPDPSPLPTGLLYYTQSNKISQIGAGLSGNTLVGRLTGPFTQLSTRGNVAFDSSGNFYVANDPGNVEEFAAGANGDVPPIRTISGANTLIHDPNSVAVDSAGDIYVADTSYINIYGPTASGDVAPIAQILIPGTSGIALDPSNDIYVNQSGCGIEEFAPGSTGTPAPTRCLNVAAPFALDSSGNLYACYGTSILGFTPTDLTPSRTITGVFTGINCSGAGSITVGSTGYIYMHTAFNGGAHVLVFTPTASGNTPFIRRIHTEGGGLLNIWPDR